MDSVKLLNILKWVGFCRFELVGKAVAQALKWYEYNAMAESQESELKQADRNVAFKFSFIYFSGINVNRGKTSRALL